MNHHEPYHFYEAGYYHYSHRRPYLSSFLTATPTLMESISLFALVIARHRPRDISSANHPSPAIEHALRRFQTHRSDGRLQRREPPLPIFIDAGITNLHFLFDFPVRLPLQLVAIREKSSRHNGTAIVSDVLFAFIPVRSKNSADSPSGLIPEIIVPAAVFPGRQDRVLR